MYIYVYLYINMPKMENIKMHDVKVVKIVGDTDWFISSVILNKVLILDDLPTYVPGFFLTTPQ